KLAGVRNGDNITASYTTAANRTSLPGNYPITPGLNDPDNRLGNYTVSVTNGTLTVTLLPLSTSLFSVSVSDSAPYSLPPLDVMALDKTRPYGSANPALTGTVSGLQNGDNITASYVTTATSASPAGAYTITPQLNDPNGKLGNYTLRLRHGLLIVKTVGVITINSIARSNDRVRIAGAGDPN